MCTTCGCGNAEAHIDGKRRTRGNAEALASATSDGRRQPRTAASLGTCR